MKNIKRFLVSIFIIMACFTNIQNIYAKDNSCKTADIIFKRSELKNVSLNYEFMPAGSSAIILVDPIDVSNKIKVSIENLPDNFYAVLSTNYGKNNNSILEKNKYAFVNGGVYTIDIYNFDCPLDNLKSFEVKIPIYNNDNKNTWFDGTYEQKSPSKNPSKNDKVSITLVVILVLLVLIVGIIGLIIYRKRKLK